MNNRQKTKQQLIDELKELPQKVSRLEAPPRYEVRMQRKDGSSFEAEINARFWMREPSFCRSRLMWTLWPKRYERYWMNRNVKEKHD